jgi:predicted nuclease of predicted toxin-antitoxin system
LSRLGLRDASDFVIFKEAQRQNAVLMTKDSDFVNLVNQHGPPPQIIWITCGNTSNAKMRLILSKTLSKAKRILESGEEIVEIGSQ